MLAIILFTYCISLFSNFYSLLSFVHIFHPWLFWPYRRVPVGKGGCLGAIENLFWMNSFWIHCFYRKVRFSVFSLKNLGLGDRTALYNSPCQEDTRQISKYPLDKVVLFAGRVMWWETLHQGSRWLLSCALLYCRVEKHYWFITKTKSTITSVFWA